MPAVSRDRPGSASIRCWSRRRPATRSRTSRSVRATAAPRRAVGDLRAPHRARARSTTCCRSTSTGRATRANLSDLPRVDRAAEVHEFLTVARRAARARVPQHHARPVLRAVRPHVRRAARARAPRRSSVCARGSCARSPTPRYNARELEAMGYRDVRVVPPVVDLRRLSTRRAAARRRMHHLATFERTDPAVRRSADAAQAARLPRADDARRRDVPRDARIPAARRASPPRALHARDPRAGAGAQPRRACTSSAGRRARPRRDVPVGRRGRDRERARRLLHPAPRGDDVREADRRPRVRGDPRDGRRRRRSCYRRIRARRSSPRRSREMLANEPLRARPGRGRAGAGWPSSSAAHRMPRSSRPCSRSSDAPALRRAALRRDDRGWRRAALPGDGRADGPARSPRRGRHHVRAVVRRLGQRVRARSLRRSAAWSCTGSGSPRRATTRGSTS